MYKIWGEPPPENMGRQKTSKIWRDLRQLSTLTTIISGMNQDIDKRLTAFSITICSMLNAKSGGLGFANHKVVSTQH